MLNKYQPSRVTGARDNDASGVIFYFLDKACQRTWKVYDTEWTNSGQNELRRLMIDSNATIVSYNTTDKVIIWAQPTSDCKNESLD